MSDVKNFNCATVCWCCQLPSFTEYRMRSDDDGTRQRTRNERPVILFQYNISLIVGMEWRSREKPEWNSECPVICNQILAEYKYRSEGPTVTELAGSVRILEMSCVALSRGRRLRSSWLHKQLATDFKGMNVTQMDNTRQSQLFLCIRWFNTTCFGLTRNHHQANKTQNKLIRKLLTIIWHGIPASPKKKKNRKSTWKD